MNTQKILVTHHGALGDVLCAWPVFCALADSFAAQKKFFLGGGNLAFLLKPLGFEPCRPKLAEADLAFYEPVNLPEKNLAIFRFCLDKEPPRIPQGASVFLGLPKEEMHVSEALASQARDFGLCVPGQPEAAARFQALHGKWQGLYSRKISFIAGAGHKAKQWPPSHFAALAEKFIERGYECEQIMGPQEIERGPDLGAAYTSVKSVATEDLSALIEKLRSSRLVVGNDSGPMHLAALCGVPCAAVFGPASARRWRPLGDASFCLESGLPCAPCSLKTDDINCSHYDCMNSISPEKLWACLKFIINPL